MYDKAIEWSLKNLMQVSIAPRKKVWRDTGRFGVIPFGCFEFGAHNAKGLDFTGVYQRAYNKKGGYHRKNRFAYRYGNGPTTKRQISRSNFANAVSSWQGLTDEEKISYNEEAKKYNRIGFNYYISKYLLSI